MMLKWTKPQNTRAKTRDYRYGEIDLSAVGVFFSQHG